MTGRLVDSHLGSYDYKLITIEGSHCSTTKLEYILNVFFYFVLGFVMYEIAVR